MTHPLILPLLSCLVFAAALLFGGGARRDLLSDFVPELLAIPLLVLAAPGAIRRLSEDRLARWILIAIVGLAILHIIPLPPSLCNLLPGREVAMASYEAAGMQVPWAPISLHPAMAAKGALALLPPAAIFCGALSMSPKERRILVLIALAVGVASVPLGILQIMGGRQNALYFYSVTNPENAVGLFANRNHFAAYLYILVPLAAGVLSEKGEAQGVPFWAILAVVWIACLIGLATTGSRSALVLGAISIVASFFLIVRSSFPQYFSGRRAKAGLAAVIGLLLVLLSAMGGAQILGRVGEDPLDDGRLLLFSTTIDLSWRFFPIGSGLGSFERLYEMMAPNEALFWASANHAHNDWAEAFMETGPAGVAIGLAFLFWVSRKMVVVWREQPGVERRLALGGALAVLLLCIHSLWDYPLRTIALSCCLAASCALLFKAPEEGAGFDLPQRRRRRGRTRRVEKASSA